MNNKKSFLRYFYKSRRQNLSVFEKHFFSKIINNKLQSLVEEHRFKKIGVYFPVKGEVDIRESIELLNNNGFKLYFPKIYGKNLVWVKFFNWNKGIFNKYNIWEPEGKDVDVNDIETLFIPAVSYDYYGNRLGYGGGFYDRSCRNYIGLKIGVSFDNQLSKQLPYENHDVKVNYIVTNKKNISVNCSLPVGAGLKRR